MIEKALIKQQFQFDEQKKELIA